MLSRRTIVVLGLVLVTAAFVAAPIGRAAECKAVRAEFPQFRTDGCPSPIGFCSTAEIDSGLLKGTKDFTALAAGPGAGLGGAEPETTVSYVGPVVISTDAGTLDVSFVGVLDTANAVFSEVGRVTGGTGAFAGASGILFVHGTVSGEGTQFDSVLTGTICLGG